MNTLLIDAGNSRLKWCWLTRDGRSEVQARPNVLLPDTGLAGHWQEQRPVAIHVACVAGEPIRAWLQQVLPPLAPVRFHQSPARCGPWRNAYADPGLLGVDRWLAMLAVPALGRDAFVLADCGTALTLDCVDATGQHLGGSILCGPDKALAALQSATALPAACPDPQPQWFNSNTGSALYNGHWLAAAASVVQFYQTAQRHCGLGTRLFLTGGGSATLAPLLPGSHPRLEHSVLQGLEHWIRLHPKG